MNVAYREPRPCEACEKPTDEGLVVIEIAGEKHSICFPCKDQLVNALIEVRRPS